jgi:hypothetical protein
MKSNAPVRTPANRGDNRTTPPEFPPVPLGTEPALISRQRAVLRDLLLLVAERAQLEPRLDQEFKQRMEAAELEFDTDYQSIIVRFASEKETVEREFQEARELIAQRFEAERAAAEREYGDARQKILEQAEVEKEATKAELQEARWTITAVFEGNRAGAETFGKESDKKLTDAAQRLQSIEQETREYLQACRQSGEYVATGGPRPPEHPELNPIPRLEEALSFAEWKLVELKSLTIPRTFRGERLLLMFIGLWLLLLYPARLVADDWLLGLVVSLAGVTAVGAVASFWLHAVARSQVHRVCEPLFQALSQATVLLRFAQEYSTTHYHRLHGEAKKRYNREVRQGTENYRRQRAEIKQRRLAGLRQAMQEYRQKRASISARRAKEWSDVSERYRLLRSEIQERYDTDSRAVQEQHDREIADCKREHGEGWQRLAQRWRDGLAQARAEIGRIQEEARQLAPDWSATAWQPSAEVPSTIRFGEYAVDLARIPPGLPRDPRLKTEGPSAFALPALMPFIPRCSLMMHASDEGRIAAVEALQAVMFRLVTAIPPGKARFTIIDPVGLGQNFASFMHLADYDEALVTSRIWTEGAHIEQRLADLTGHMENVIQKYLRNQFQTIEEYNVHAGEVAEPYRLLVVANFPVNFTIDAARRLVSIVQSGARCGVHTLITIDTKHPLPQGFSLNDLMQPGVQLVWKDGHFLWHDSDFARFPLKLDPPPEVDLGMRVLKQVGEKARDAKRVEVPFEFVAPRPEEWWTGDSRPGISVPLGRVGATKRQHLKLGQGTAQHVLIAGKTGSGKSTLLHALISNLSLVYSPREVELYLIDFKKGVEFKTYANHQLPHARVIAIESEREFGLSVLQRLDGELKHRAEMFRRVEAQDLRSYREANGEVALPRILLVVDEFQEFFVEDDKIAQDAALLLDRLVRQGRAFGLHVLLGSQTLGGAYTLARSTIDQMGVRIALQCSEVDAHAILSEDNSAARLLSRPGEAIYNDANGRVEGNNPFQVVWLDDDRREQYLEQIQQMARQRALVPAQPQIVFEGNAPADAAKNGSLSELLRAPSWPVPVRTAHAWLGEAMAIKDPTAADFRMQSGGNLLIVGQHEEASLGILATALLGLAAQHPPDGKGAARFYVLDGSLEDDPGAGFLDRLPAVLPHALKIVHRHELPQLMAELAEEVDRRQKTHVPDAPRLYLALYGLHRFRDLRREDDDFGFSRRGDEPTNPARQFTTLVREGPGLGIHSLVWCDSLNNVNRALDRPTLREFELRVLFQMSAADSSTLIDTPVASKLGLFRALFLSEEQGRLEKFRPYGLPPASWLEWVQQQFERKGASRETANPSS